MSYVSTLGFGQKHGGVRIAWPRGHGLPGEQKRMAPDHTAVGMDAGMRVLSRRGLVAAGELGEGDMVADGRGGWTRVAAVLRISCEFGEDRVEIAAGALGGGLPTVPLVVGRQSRLQVLSGVAQRLVGCARALVAAETLLGLEGITLHGSTSSDIVHVVFDEHGTLVAEDVVIEALVPTDACMESLPYRHAAALYRAVPRLRYAGALAAFATDLPELDAREMRQVLEEPVSFGTVPPAPEDPVLRYDNAAAEPVPLVSAAQSG